MFEKNNNFLLIVLLFLAAGFLVTSFASYFAARSSLREEITGNSLPLTSDNIYSEIQRDLLKPTFISSLMASDTFLRDWAIRGEKDLDEIARYLSEIKTRYNTITSFFVSDVTENYYYAGGILKKVNPSEERDIWYYRVRGMEEDFEINIDPDLANNDAMTIFINYKVFDYGGNFIGAAGVGLTVNNVVNRINEYQKKYRRNIWFTDKSGQITLKGFSSDEAVTGAKRISEIGGILNYSEKILENEVFTFSYRRAGRTYYVNSRYIDEFDWFLFVEESDEDGARALVRTLLINIAICVTVTIVILLVVGKAVKSYQQRIEKLASTDKLTGTLNRLAFDIITEQAMLESDRNGKPLSFIIIDIDYFKEINDSLGHLKGDEVLKLAVEIIRKQLRSSDVLCRWGGDEFFILLKECSIDDAYELAEKTRKAAKETRIPAGETVSAITLSCGVTLYKKGDTGESVLERADKALYMAKEGGRDRSVML